MLQYCLSIADCKIEYRFATSSKELHNEHIAHVVVILQCCFLNEITKLVGKSYTIRQKS